MESPTKKAFILANAMTCFGLISLYTITMTTLGNKDELLNLIKTSFTHIVSLGCNCFPKQWLNKKKLPPAEFLPFDWVGSSMWSITNLIRTGFEDFPSSELKHIRVIEGLNTILTDTKHYIRFLHEIRKDIPSKYPRRAKRLMEILDDTNNKILFLRMEEDFRNRLPIAGLPHILEDEEIHLDAFVTCLREKCVSFRIIYINSSIDRDDDDHVLYLKTDPLNPIKLATLIQGLDDLMTRDDRVLRWLKKMQT
jgi:hypothetical protein